MKKYASNRAQKGKTAYRTPSRFKAAKAQHHTQLARRQRSANTHSHYGTAI